MNFVHLHNHSMYSYLDAISTPKELIERAKELDMPAISINDHASINALPEMLKHGKKNNIKAIIGVEFYVVFRDDPFLNKKNETRYHLNVMAKNWEGVKVLFKKLTLANKQKYYRPRLYDDQIFDFGDNVIISTACAISMLMRDDYKDIAKKFKETYKDNFFLEIIPVSFKVKDKRDRKKIKDNPIEMPDQAKIMNLRVIGLCKLYNINLVCTMDTHYCYPEHRLAHEVSLCISTRDKISKSRDERFYFDGAGVNDGNYVFNEFKKLKYIDDETIKLGIKNTVIVSNKCEEIVMPEFTFNLPKPYKGDDYKIFKKKVNDGFVKFGYSKKENVDEYKKRILHEVGVIKELNLIRYFLIVEDIVRFCNENNISTGYSRGSCGSSLIASCLGITKRIDPIKEGLLFERFLNKSRASQADIDQDIGSERFQEVIDYLYSKYGEDKVAPIGAFTKLSPKNAFRDVCSVYEIPHKITNKLSKLVEEGNIKENGKLVGNYSRMESFDHVDELIKFKKENKHIIKIVEVLNGRTRQATRHACGWIISSVPIDDVGVIECRKNNEFCLNWDKDISEYTFCLLKLDLLKLQTASITDYACELVRNKYKNNLYPDNIPLDDKKTENLIASGDTIGVFQLESALARKFLKDSKKGTINNCSNVSAANRPGPLGAILDEGKSASQHYIDRVSGKEKTTHFIPQYEEILKESNSIMLFQEQLMAITSKIAGFTNLQSDTFRKLVAKKKGKSEFEAHRVEFTDGCIRHSGLSLETANAIFDSFLSCVRYLFCKAHSYAYAIHSFSGAYLKAHYPIEFYCSNFTFSDNEKTKKYIIDAKKHNIKIKTPDINLSDATKWTIVDDELIAPLNCIKYVGDKAANSIIKIRKQLVKFITIDEFNRSLDLNPGHNVNKRCMAGLYYSDVFKSINHYERDLKKLAEKQIEYLDIFSPMPYIDLNEVKEASIELYNKALEPIIDCENDYGYIDPIRKGNPSVVIVVELSKFEKQILEKNKWFIQHISKKLNISESKLYITAPIKCDYFGIDKKQIPDQCWDKGKEILKNEIISLNPNMVINCSSKVSSWFAPKGKFMQSFGEITYSSFIDCYYINMPSPAWMAYKQNIKEEYINKILPLFDKIIKNIDR